MHELRSEGGIVGREDYPEKAYQDIFASLHELEVLEEKAATASANRSLRMITVFIFGAIIGALLQDLVT